MSRESCFTVITPTQPIELELLQSERIPQKIITFQTAAVLTLLELFPRIEITLIRVDRKNFLFQDSKQALFVREMECFDQYLERYSIRSIRV